MDPATVPEEYRRRMGRISDEQTMPQLKRFVESGGSIVTIGSSTSIAEVFGIPVKNHLVEKGPDGKDRAPHCPATESHPHLPSLPRPRWLAGQGSLSRPWHHGSDA